MIRLVHIPSFCFCLVFIKVAGGHIIDSAREKIDEKRVISSALRMRRQKDALGGRKRVEEPRERERNKIYGVKKPYPLKTFDSLKPLRDMK